MDRAVAWFLLLAVYLYRQTLSPIFGNQCRFHPTCSVYAVEALKTKKVFKALFLILKRISKCHPLHSGGYDPVK
ncbi:MAG: membrane protein insertion efficiency factor YidD [Candidatus Marinimicrobia bacterium]|nr:membrane protein insertion efficiency factor YidD [Candidatus Neomarinimicrobiota bacterium]